MKVELIRLKPWERKDYPKLKSKSELKKLKLQPRKNVKPRAIVNRKSYGDYYLYDETLTEVFHKSKTDLMKEKKKRKKYVCIKCGKYIGINRWQEFGVCNKCAEELLNEFDENRDQMVKDIMSKNIICLDTETTGLNSWDDEILQVSAVNQNGEILINEFCKPIVKDTWEDAESIHGITPKQVKNCCPYSFYKDHLQTLVSAAEIIVGYNIGFDLDFLNLEIRQDQIIYDVMKNFAYVYKEYNYYHKSYSWQKLLVCADYYGYIYDAHDSLEDAKATLYCYPKVKCDLGREEIFHRITREHK